MSDWIDITRPMDDTLLTWPGRARPKVSWEKRVAKGDHCNVSFWELSAHSGTHMDAPLHFEADGLSIDQVSPDVFIGECRVVALPQPLDETAAQRLAGVRRLLLKSVPSWNGQAHGALMTEAAVAVLLAHGLVLLGTDRLTVDDSAGKDFALHHALLGDGAVIIEGLRLDDVAEGVYGLHAASLRMAGAEASPVRAFLAR